MLSNSCYPYPFSQMNADYLVKVKTRENTRGRLLGVRGLVALLGEDLAIRVICKAMLSRTDKFVCRPRHGICLTFYYR